VGEELGAIANLMSAGEVRNIWRALTDETTRPCNP